LRFVGWSVALSISLPAHGVGPRRERARARERASEREREKEKELKRMGKWLTLTPSSPWPSQVAAAGIAAWSFITISIGVYVIYSCMHACMYACMRACMHACMHVCMHACMYACMHAFFYCRMVLHNHLLRSVRYLLVCLSMYSSSIVYGPA